MRAAGQYVLLYDGNGTVGLTGDAAVTSSAPGRLVLQITPSSGFYVRILKTTDADPVRNIRIVPASFEATYDAQVGQLDRSFSTDSAHSLAGGPTAFCW